MFSMEVKTIVRRWEKRERPVTGSFRGARRLGGARIGRAIKKKNEQERKHQRRGVACNHEGQKR